MIDIKSAKIEINKYFFNFEYLLIDEKNLKINIDHTKQYTTLGDKNTENMKKIHIYIECVIVNNKTSGVVTWYLDLNAQSIHAMNTTLNIQNTNLVKIIPVFEVSILS